MPTFRATILKVGPGYWVDVPASVVEELGRARLIPVTVRYAGDAHPSTVTPGREGRGRLSLHADVFRAHGLKVGDKLDVSLTLDRAPRTVTVPPDLQRALTFRPAAATGWEQAAPSTRRVVIEQFNEARTSETRARRIERLVEQFAERATARAKKKQAAVSDPPSTRPPRASRASGRPVFSLSALSSQLSALSSQLSALS